jgi:hypothetical protein
MGNKDRAKREIKKPKKKPPQMPIPAKRTLREDFNKAAFRGVQETIPRSDSK